MHVRPAYGSLEAPSVLCITLGWKWEGRGEMTSGRIANRGSVGAGNMSPHSAHVH